MGKTKLTTEDGRTITMYGNAFYVDKYVVSPYYDDICVYEVMNEYGDWNEIKEVDTIQEGIECIFKLIEGEC